MEQTLLYDLVKSKSDSVISLIRLPKPIFRKGWTRYFKIVPMHLDFFKYDEFHAAIATCCLSWDRPSCAEPVIRNKMFY